MNHWSLTIGVAAVCLCAGLARQPVDANQIALGLDWRKGVFVQEYWQAGAAHYVVCNTTAHPVSLSVAEWQSQARKKNPLLVGPLAIGAHAVATVDADTPGFKALGEQALLEFSDAEGSLGLLTWSAKMKPAPGKTVCYDGLNGSGGRHSDIWTEQDKLIYAPGDEIAVTLMVPANSGIIKWSMVLPDEKKVSTTIATLPLVRADSDTLAVKTDAGQAVIDTFQAAGDPRVHAVKLYFHAPPLTTGEMMFMINGLVTGPNGGGFGITRGMVVMTTEILD